MTPAERLRRAEEIVCRLRAARQDLDAEEEAKLERLRLLAMIEAVFPCCRIWFEELSPAEPSRSCSACGRRAWWRSVHGVIVCGVCHPPASADLVAEYIGYADA